MSENHRMGSYNIMFASVRGWKQTLSSHPTPAQQNVVDGCSHLQEVFWTWLMQNLNTGVMMHTNECNGVCCSPLWSTHLQPQHTTLMYWKFITQSQHLWKWKITQIMKSWGWHMDLSFAVTLHLSSLYHVHDTIMFHRMHVKFLIQHSS